MQYRTIVENQVAINNIFFPTSIMIKLTNRCNLRCGFCSQGESKNVDLDWNTIMKVLQEANQYGVYEIVYSGGEPLLYDRFREVIEYGKQLGLRQVLVTNGIYLDKHLDEVLDNVDQIGISIHGGEAIHDATVGYKGAYRKVADNIEKVIQTKNAPSLMLNFTITGNNVDSIEDVVSFAKSHGCKLSVARLNQIGRSAHNTEIQNTINHFFEQLATDSGIRVSNVIPVCQMPTNKKYLCHSCSAGLASVCIEADSTVKICASSTQVFGSMMENSLYEVWNNEQFSRFRSLDWMPDLCKTCRDYAKCLGGCKAEILENPYSQSKDCLMTTAIEKFYHECKVRKMEIHITNVRRINDDYLLIGAPNRIIDEEGLMLLRELLRTKNIEEYFGNMEDLHRKQALELLYGMHKDGLLSFR